MTNEELTIGQSRDARRESRGSRAQRWEAFINELRSYIEEHHLCPPKHCTLYNEQKYYRRKLKEGKLGEDKSKELEDVLGMRDLSIHTGGRRKSSNECKL